MEKRFFPNRALALLLGAAWLALAAGAGWAAKQPKIKFKNDSWDFGKVKQGAVLDYEFVFKNTGSAKLTITSVSTSCGCTAALATDKTLEPGQEGKVKVSFNTSGYSGAVSKYITVDSDDPDEPRLQLKVAAVVEVPPAPRAEVSPYSQDLGLLLEGQDAEAQLTLHNRGELELQVDVNQKNVAFTAGSKPVTFPLRIAAGKEVALKMKMALPNRTGLLKSEYVVFRTNDPVNSALYFTLSGYIVTKAQLKELFNRYKDILK